MRSERHVLSAALPLLISLVLMAGCGASTTTAKQAAVTRTGSVTMSAFPDSFVCHGSNGGPGGGAHPEWVTYCPGTDIRVPAHAMVTMTIKQYDTGDSIPQGLVALRGTVGGVIEVNGKPVSRVDPANVAHTFTVRPIAGAEDGLPSVNVPLPGVPASAPSTELIAGHHYPKPVVIVFRLKTGAAGKYSWYCNLPCGGGKDGFGRPMLTHGYMAGTLTVT
jgi:hypothetical protein